jgi:hypothetical protein
MPAEKLWQAILHTLPDGSKPGTIQTEIVGKYASIMRASVEATLASERSIYNVIGVTIKPVEADNASNQD